MRERILVVDDDESFCEIVGNVLTRRYQVATVPSGEDALEEARQFAPDLVLLDVLLPGIDGLETCRRLKSAPLGERAQVVVMSAELAGLAYVRAFEAGADDYMPKPFRPKQLLDKVGQHLRLREVLGQLTPPKPNGEPGVSTLEGAVAERTRQIMAAPGFSVATLLMLAESREPEDPNRLQRLRYYALVLGAELGRSSAYADQVSAKSLDHLYRSVPLHDVGKIGVPDSILLKKEPLIPAETELMKAHTKIGAALLQQVADGCRGGQFLRMASALAAFHHERFDGAGYPAGIAGQAIPLPARILAVADAYDRATLSAEASAQRVEETLQAGVDSQFDPVVVEACRASLAELASTKRQLSEGWPVVAGAASFLA